MNVRKEQQIETAFEVCNFSVTFIQQCTWIE